VNPALIGRMATEFIASGWRIKPLIRALVLSATYGQSGRGRSLNGAGRPIAECARLTRHQRHRLEPKPFG
jgi:hypothetical protein